jgi:hypothetical protein
MVVRNSTGTSWKKELALQQTKSTLSGLWERRSTSATLSAFG